MEATRLSEVRIKDHIGKRLFISFVASEVEVKPQKNNQNYMSIIMRDKSEKQAAKIFSVTDPLVSMVKNGCAYDAFIEVKRFNDGYSCIIDTIQESSIKVSDFVDKVDNMEVYIETIKLKVKELEGTVYHSIVLNIINDNWQKFVAWPAAKGHHHNLSGGLLAHTATVAAGVHNMALMYNKIYPGLINIHLAIAAALLHDIGKVLELDIDFANGEIKYSPNYILDNHVTGGIEIITKEAIKQNLDDTEEVRLLRHCIATHHGKPEWGAHLEPAVPEAHLLFRVDEMDAIMFKANKHLGKLSAGESNVVWNDSSMDRYYKDSTKTN